jgi:Meckel syndrome type 1 protein
MNTPTTPSGNAPDPRCAPLDAEEAQVAAALDALPGGTPSAALDARILAMAREAVAPQARAHGVAPGAPRQRPRRRSSALWWLGSAAGAVMAAGIGWQISGLHPASPDGADRTSSVQSRPGAQREDEMEVVIIPRGAREAEPSAVSESANSAASAALAERSALADQASRRREADIREVPAAIQPVAPAAPAMAPSPLPAPTPGLSQDMQRQEAPAAGSGIEAGEQPQLERIEVTGTRISGFPPVVQDFRLSPEDWLQRIRDRRDSGDLDAARRSVREFVRAHPHRVLPKDLRQLLNEAP